MWSMIPPLEKQYLAYSKPNILFLSNCIEAGNMPLQERSHALILALVSHCERPQDPAVVGARANFEW
jgi:hypothetical protein